MKGSPHRTSYLIAGVLALISILGIAAVFAPVMDCPTCGPGSPPRRYGWMGYEGFDFCRNGRVTPLEWLQVKREQANRPSPKP